MAISKKHALALAVIGAITVAGCNSGSDSNANKRAAAGFKHTGVITGFGSVYVNGVKYETGQTTVSVEDKNGSMNDLEIGMVITLDGSVNADGTTGVATHISYSDELEGVVSAVNIATDGTGTLTVMGQTVKVSGTTTFESNVAAVTAMNLIVSGNIVEVSGYSAGDGKIVATRVEVKKAAWEAGDEIEVKGVITDLKEADMTFMLGGLMVHYNAAKIEHTLTNGLYVEVKSTEAPVGNMLNASKVEIEGDGKKGVDGHEGDKFELEGVVGSVISTTEFVLTGQTVLIDNGTEFENGSAATIAVDAKLEVEGTLNADGKLVADEVEFRHESSIEIKAKLQSIDATAGTITVLDQTVSVNSLTLMIGKSELCTMSFPATCTIVLVHDFSLSKLKVGDVVELHIAMENGKLIATKLEHDDSIVDIMEVTLEGPVTAISGTQVTIAGVKVELGVLLGTRTVVIGDELEVSGVFANGLLTANKVE